MSSIYPKEGKIDLQSRVDGMRSEARASLNPGAMVISLDEGQERCRNFLRNVIASKSGQLETLTLPQLQEMIAESDFSRISSKMICHSSQALEKSSMFLSKDGAIVYFFLMNSQYDLQVRAKDVFKHPFGVDTLQAVRDLQLIAGDYHYSPALRRLLAEYEAADHITKMCRAVRLFFKGII